MLASCRFHLTCVLLAERGLVMNKNDLQGKLKSLQLNADKPAKKPEKELMGKECSYVPNIGLRGSRRSHAHTHESIPVLATVSHSVVCQLMSVMAR